MASVRLSNGSLVNIVSSICPDDINMSKLIENLEWTNPLNVRHQAITILKELGLLAKEAVRSLELIVKIENNTQFVSEALSALEKISPESYRHMHNRFDISNKRQVTQTYGPHNIHGVEKSNILVPNTQVSTNVVKKEESKQPLEESTEIEIVATENASDLEEDSKVYRKCLFCEHETLLTSISKKILKKLCPPGEFYCPFCLRHNYHTRDGKNIMILSFRGIFGYFYYEFYCFAKSITHMYLSEIQDYIDLHVSVGLQNPVFSYNKDNYCWYVDFRKIGQSKKKLPIETVYSTITEILASFNLQYNIRSVQMNKLFEKYREAVEKFYEKRYRPEGQKLCIPTLKGCGVFDWAFTTCGVNAVATSGSKPVIDDTKAFLPHFMATTNYWNRSAS